MSRKITCAEVRSGGEGSEGEVSAAGGSSRLLLPVGRAGGDSGLMISTSTTSTSSTTTTTGCFEIRGGADYHHHHHHHGVGGGGGETGGGGAAAAAPPPVRRRGGAGGGGLQLPPLPPGHDDMEVVLDSIVCPAREEPGNESPFVAIQPVGSQQPLLLLLPKCPPVDPWVQLVEPPQPAALPCN